MTRLLEQYRFLTIATIVAIVLIVTTATIFIYFLYVPLVRRDINQVEIIVEEGDGLIKVAEKLHNSDLIHNKFVFILYVKVRGEESDLKAGRYVLSKSLNISTIAGLIVSGKSKSDDIKVVIPEGSNIWEIDERLVEAGLVSEAEFGSKYYDNEGYLFPDTYSVSKVKSKNEKVKNDTEEKLIVKELKEKMRENFQQKTATLFKNLDTEKKKDVVIIASILEKEAKKEEDMKLVSGIIQKRLELGIPLQIDATVIYGACLRNFQFSIFNLQKTKNCDVTFQSPAEELKIDGLFNTYTRKGLPPAPISNPGLQAIEAALNPTSSDYLYYLSTRDGSQMIYSKIPAEHAANRRKYLGI